MSTFNDQVRQVTQNYIEPREHDKGGTTHDHQTEHLIQEWTPPSTAPTPTTNDAIIAPCIVEWTEPNK